MFSLEGFDYPEAYEETDSGSGGGGVLFPQSDDEDEEISTDGKRSKEESYKTSWRISRNELSLKCVYYNSFSLFCSPPPTDSSYHDVSALNTSGLPSSVPVSVPMFRRSKTVEENYEGGSVRSHIILHVY